MPLVRLAATHSFATSYVNALIDQVKHTLSTRPNAKQHIDRLLRQADDATIMVLPPENEWFAQLRHVQGNVTSVCVRVPLTLRLPYVTNGACRTVNKWFELEVRWASGAANDNDPLGKTLAPIVERQLRRHSDVLEHAPTELLRDTLLYRTSADYDPRLSALLDAPTTHRIAATLAGTLLGSVSAARECADIHDFAKTMRVLCEPCEVDRTMAALWEADDDSSDEDSHSQSPNTPPTDCGAKHIALHQPLVAVLGVVTTQLPVPTLWDTLRDVTEQVNGVFECLSDASETHASDTSHASDTHSSDTSDAYDTSETHAFYALVPRAHGLCVEHTLRKRVRNYPDTTFTSSIARVEERGATMPIRAHPCLVEMA